MRILIVDDSATTRVALAALLKRRGHAVVAAGDGDEAWWAYEKQPAQVIISDWAMPGLNGVELCRRVRATPGGPQPFFIMFTWLSGKQDYADGKAAGVDDFIPKPIDEAHLDASLRVAERVIGLR
ncbi:response regulator transcription factor [bacterium]|nr:response regulator transcription factor [bacterium]